MRVMIYNKHGTFITRKAILFLCNSKIEFKISPLSVTLAFITLKDFAVVAVIWFSDKAEV